LLGTTSALFAGMQLHTAGRSAKSFSKGNRKNSPPGSTAGSSVESRPTVDEINSYIAIRDLRMATVERSTTPENLRLASLANDFVETCLERPPLVYAAQYLPETSAAFERKRCLAVSKRIAELSQAAS
jgi:hypothetical protein